MTAADTWAEGGETPLLDGPFGFRPATPTLDGFVGGSAGPGVVDSDAAPSTVPPGTGVTCEPASGVSDGARVLATSQAESNTSNKTRGATFRIYGKG